jgi:hypothetical protein
VQYFSPQIPEVLELWGAPLWGGGEGGEFIAWGTYKIYILIGTLLSWNILLIAYHLVPVLAPNYKQHILSPAKVWKVCYSLAELYVRSVYFNLFGGGGATFMKYFKGGTSCKNLGTSAIYKQLHEKKFSEFTHWNIKFIQKIPSNWISLCFASVPKDLLAILILWFSSAFWWRAYIYFSRWFIFKLL